MKLSYPLASGGNLTTTLPISAPGSSMNFPSSFRSPLTAAKELALSLDCAMFF